MKLNEFIDSKAMNADHGLSGFKRLVEKQELKRARSAALVIGLASGYRDTFEVILKTFVTWCLRGLSIYSNKKEL